MPNRPKRPTQKKPDAEPARPKKRAQPVERTRKKTAAPPVPGRITAMRQRNASRAPEKAESARSSPTARSKANAKAGTAKRTRVASAAKKPSLILVRPGFPDADAALRYLLKRAEELVQDGVHPRLPYELYLDALVPVLTFIHARKEVFAEANLGAEVCAAVEQIAAELQAAPSSALDRVSRTESPPHETTATGALLLTAYRDAVRRVSLGPRGLLARQRFGIGDTLDVRNPDQVASGIERFLDGAVRHPEYLQETGLSRKQLDGLSAQRRVILAQARERRILGVPSISSVQSVRVLHAALEYFFDRFSAAVSAKLFHQPEERVRGLRLVPRDSTNRSGGLRSTDSH